MAKRECRGNIGSFSRGTELWLNQARFFLSAVKAMLIVAVLPAIATTGIYFWKSTTANEKYALERHALAYTLDAFFMSERKIDLNVNGKLYQIEAEKVMRLTNGITAVALQKLKKGGLWGLWVAIGSALLVSLYWWRHGKQKITDKRLRGARLVEGQELAKLLKSRSDASDYLISGCLCAAARKRSIPYFAAHPVQANPNSFLR